MGTHETHTNEDDFFFESPETSSVRPVLMVFDQNKLHEWHMIAQKETTVGRDAEVDIQLNDDTVSRVHATIIFQNIDRPSEEPRCVLVDNNSRNGAYLNGKRVTQPVALQNGDRVFIGNTCLAFFIRTEMEINSDQQLRSLATTDGLTGLMNRGFMAIQFQREFDRSKRYMRPLSVLMMDLDDFKKINDTYGHQAGDLVLEQIARLIESKTRIHDSAARYGGEEFAVLLPETNLQGAHVIAERLRRSVNSFEFRTNGATIQMTISIGVAELDLSSEMDLEKLLECADKALLQAKREGKNRVCTYREADQ